jgi:hypothetical protein
VIPSGSLTIPPLPSRPGHVSFLEPRLRFRHHLTRRNLRALVAEPSCGMSAHLHCRL